MNDTKKTKKQKPLHTNTLESLKDIGVSTASSLKKDVVRPNEFIDQIIGPGRPQKFSGEISVGESLEMSEVLSGEHQEKKKVEKQLSFERRIRIEEDTENEKKINELKIQLNAISKEILQIAQETEELSEDVKLATMQAPIEPGVYHVVFFEKLLEFIKSFRKKISEAHVWLHALNKRAQKKNAWGSRYKKHGAKYLLSGEHYLSRSAG